MLRRALLPLPALLLASPLLAQTQPDQDKGHGASGTIQLQPALELQRMRSLLSQMQTNLAMFPPGYSAIKHQAELEIEMWTMVLRQMERAESTGKQ